MHDSVAVHLEVVLAGHRYGAVACIAGHARRREGSAEAVGGLHVGRIVHRIVLAWRSYAIALVAPATSMVVVRRVMIVFMVGLRCVFPVEISPHS